MFGRRRSKDDFTKEIEAHLELEADEWKREGSSEEEARRKARLEFGNVQAAQERFHLKSRVVWLDNRARDIKFALRQLVKNPGFAATAVLVLALGIGSCIAVFAFVDAALIKPLPYETPARLVALFENMSLGPQFHISYLDFQDWQRLNRSFSSLDIYSGGSLTLSTPSGVQPADVANVSSGFFHTLGVAPVLGRGFLEGEESSSTSHTAMLSYAGWQERFGGRRDVLGSPVTLDGVTYTVIGVLPRDFHFVPVEPAEFWILVAPGDSCSKDRGCHNYSGVARLKDGVTMQAAMADMVSIADRLAGQYPDADAHRGATVLALSDLITGSLRPILVVLLAGAALLFLIAAVNVASLLLVRSEVRKREFAVRGAMGASPARLVGQLITEGLVLVSCSVILGLVSAEAAIKAALRLLPISMRASLPYLQDLGLHARVIGFACLLSLIAALLFCLIPALRLFRSTRTIGMRDALAAGGRGSAGTLWRKFGSHLVVIELAMAMVLLVAAGLLGRSFYRLLHTDIGLRPEHLTALRIAAPAARYATDGAAVPLQRRLALQLAALPSVQSVGSGVQLPVGVSGGSTVFRVAGRPYHGEHVEALNREVDPGYLPTIGAQLMRGRNFTQDDDTSRPQVTIINQAMARTYFPGEDPIGKRIVLGDNPVAKEIVGIIEDIKEGPLDAATQPALYFPFAQEPDRRFFIVVRSSLPEQEMLPLLSSAIEHIDPMITISQPTVMQERIQNSPAAYLHRSSAWLVGALALMALLLGVVGLYGVIAYSVGQRTREIGVRMALGAQRRAVYNLVLKEATWLTASGILVGLGCSMMATTLMRKLLFGTEPWDLLTFSAVTTLLAVCALLASFIPARRAASVDPVDALRAE
jgi:macrolide transport system ATP-binding/permease protein